jgi:hypothetical protein
MSIPADAGPVLRDLRKRSRVSDVIILVLAVMLLLIVAGDPKSWPLAAIFGGAGVLAWLLYKLRKRAVAICEHGLVVARAGRTTLVPWDRVKRVRILRGKYTAHVVDYDDTNCLLTDHAADSLIGERIRGPAA